MAEEDFDFVDVMDSASIDGEIKVSVGSATENVSWTKDCPVLGMDGFYSVPYPKDDFGAAQALVWNDGNTQYVLSCWDSRSISQVGALQPGDRAIATRGEARIILKEASDSVSILSRANGVDPEGNPNMGISVDGSNDAISLYLGSSIIQITEKSIMISAGATQLVLDEDGVQINGKYFACNTGGGCLGLLAPGATPPPVTNSILYGPLGQAGVASMSWTIKP